MKITALAGGVGGAKLAHGFSKITNPEDLIVIVNTGDDFRHFGLHISPDIDTVCYTLSDHANLETGWGRREETLNVFRELKAFQAPDWFLLGDKDLALHLLRTQLLGQGKSLTEVTQIISQRLGVLNAILPMTDGSVRTIVDTVEYGELPFQEYFVKHHFQLRTKGFRFEGIENSLPTEAAISALKKADLVVLCPSNPFVSINPILNLQGVKSILKEKFVIAVSPIIGGRAVKGPLGFMFEDYGLPVSGNSVLKIYADFVNVFIIDHGDKVHEYQDFDSSIIIKQAEILIPTIQKRIDLAKNIAEIYENEK